MSLGTSTSERCIPVAALEGCPRQGPTAAPQIAYAVLTNSAPAGDGRPRKTRRITCVMQAREAAWMRERCEIPKCSVPIITDAKSQNLGLLSRGKGDSSDQLLCCRGRRLSDRSIRHSASFQVGPRPVPRGRNPALAVPAGERKHRPSRFARAGGVIDTHGRREAWVPLQAVPELPSPRFP